MKYCVYCGKQLDDRAVICTDCGCPTDEFKNFGSSANVENNARNDINGRYSNPLASIGLTFSLIAPALIILQIIYTSVIGGRLVSLFVMLYVAFAITGLVCSSVALSRVNKSDKMRGKGRAIAGVVISSILLAFVLFFCFI